MSLNTDPSTPGTFLKLLYITSSYSGIINNALFFPMFKDLMIPANDFVFGVSKVTSSITTIAFSFAL